MTTQRQSNNDKVKVWIRMDVLEEECTKALNRKDAELQSLRAENERLKEKSLRGSSIKANERESAFNIIKENERLTTTNQLLEAEIKKLHRS